MERECFAHGRFAPLATSGRIEPSPPYHFMTGSHVIKAMGYSDDEANEAIRLSWCHLTPEVDWEAVAARIVGLR